MIWHQSLPSYIGMHSWQIKCVVLSVTVSVVDVEPVQQAAPPCFSSKHTTHCPESRSCLKHELQVGRHWEDFGVACGGSRILLAAILKSNHIYIMNCDQLSVKKTINTLNTLYYLHLSALLDSTISRKSKAPWIVKHRQLQRSCRSLSAAARLCSSASAVRRDSLDFSFHQVE